MRELSCLFMIPIFKTSNLQATGGQMRTEFILDQRSGEEKKRIGFVLFRGSLMDQEIWQ